MHKLRRKTFKCIEIVNPTHSATTQPFHPAWLSLISSPSSARSEDGKILGCGYAPVGGITHGGVRTQYTPLALLRDEG